MDKQPIQFDLSHNVDIINYYYTNYSNCPEDTSNLATWHFLSGFTHFVFVIQLPLVLFTAYCIIRKTPAAMGSLKWAMLNLHVWTTIIDVLVCSLATPYMFFPAMSGFSVGLLRVLGVPAAVQAYIGIVAMGFMLNSISALFENRSSAFEINRFRFTSNTARLAFFTFNGALTAILLIPLFCSSPDQDKAKLEQLKILPCPHKEFFTSPVFILTSDDSWVYYLAVVLTAQFIWILSSCVFFISLLTYHIFYSVSVVYSQMNRNLQKRFFIGNLIQVIIPIAFWAVPGCGLIVIYFSKYYNQSLNNVDVAFVSLHGLTTTLVTLFIHSPYRKFIRGIFKKKVASAVRFTSNTSFF